MAGWEGPFLETTLKPAEGELKEPRPPVPLGFVQLIDGWVTGEGRGATDGRGASSRKGRIQSDTTPYKPSIIRYLRPSLLFHTESGSP